VGTTHFCQLQAALELARRHLAADLARGEALLNPQVTRRYLTAWLRAREREVFGGLFLDNRHRVLAAEELFQGSIDSAAVHPREIVKRALALNAAAVIVAHNHPSGVAEPSRADELLTRRLHDALALVEVRLLDHFIVGDGEPVSLAERGLI
jgi:DNA repair protein RadC